MLVFTSEEDGNQEFLDGPLNGDDRNDTQHGMGRIPEFKEPLCVQEKSVHATNGHKKKHTKNSKNPSKPIKHEI